MAREDELRAEMLRRELARRQQAPPSAPEPAGLGREVLRGINLGIARLGDIGLSPVREGLQAAGVPISDAPVQGLFDRIGFTSPPESAAGRFAQTMARPVGESLLPGAGLLAAGARVGAGAAAPIVRLAGAAPGRFAGAELAGATGAGLGAAMGERVGGERGQALGGLLGGLAPAAAAGAVRRAFRGAPTRTVEEQVVSPATGEVSTATRPDTIPGRLGAFERTGVSPSAGQVGGTYTGRYLEAAAGALPGGNVVAQRFAARQGRELQAAVDRVVRRIGDGVPSAEQAGTVMRRGVEEFGERFQARTESLYRALDDQIPPSTPVSARNTAAALEELTTPVAGMEATTAQLVPKEITRWQQSLAADLQATGMIPYQGIKRLRSEIGEMIGQPTLSAESARKSQLRRLYAALSEDMKAAAEAAGPAARKLFDRANALYARGQSYMKQELEPAVRRLEDEGIFTGLERGNKDGATKLNRMRTALKPDQWRTVTAAVINRMGRATPGRQDATGQAFSPLTFLTNWARLAPEARRALLPRARDRRAVEDLATVAQRIDESATALPNPSGTVIKGVTSFSIFAGILRPDYIAEIATAAGSSVGALALMTSKPFVRWLAQSTRLPVTQIPGHIGRLANVAKDSPELGPFIRAWVESLAAPDAQAPALSQSPTGEAQP